MTSREPTPEDTGDLPTGFEGFRILHLTDLHVDMDEANLQAVDDAHFYKVHNLHQAGDGIPAGSVSILLSHTPEIWRESSYAGFDVFLCGHTHGGQICLPGAFL